MKTNKQSGFSKASILFSIVAIVFLLIAAFSIYQAHDTIANAKIQYGALKFKDVLNVYLQACTPSFAYAFILYGIGVVLNKVNDLNGSLSICLDDAIDVTEKEAGMATPMAETATKVSEEIGDTVEDEPMEEATKKNEEAK